MPEGLPPRGQRVHESPATPELFRPSLERLEETRLGIDCGRRPTCEVFLAAEFADRAEAAPIVKIAIPPPQVMPG